MEEDIEICKDKINFLNEKYADEHGEDYFPVLAITTTFNARTILAFENVLRRLKQDEKVIEKMAECINNLGWSDLDNNKDIIDHFRKKCV